MVINECPLHAVDYFPTFLDLAGVPLGVDIDGKSAKMLFKADYVDWSNRPLFWHLASQYKHGTCSAIKKGNFKLIEFLKDGAIELYILSSDPLEAENIADVLPEKRDELLAELEKWRKYNQMPLPINSILEY